MKSVSLSRHFVFCAALFLVLRVVVSAQKTPLTGSAPKSTIAVQASSDQAPPQQPTAAPMLSLGAAINGLPHDVWSDVSFDAARIGRVGVTHRRAAATPFDAAQQAEQAPPPRRFVPALLRNLVDDVKHMPRRNTIYWLAGGAALVAAIRPADDTVNARLVGSDTADTVFKPGHIIGATPVQLGATAATYLIGTVRHQPRVRRPRLRIPRVTPARSRCVSAGCTWPRVRIAPSIPS